MGVTIELDGVIVDGAARRGESLAAAFAAEGIDLPIERAWLDLSADFGDLVADCIAAEPTRETRATLDDTARALIAHRAEREDRARVGAGVTLIDGARDAVAALASEWRIAVVTGWRRADAERVLALAELDDSVRLLVAADDGPGFASARTRYTRAISRLQHSATRFSGTPGIVAALVAGRRGATAATAAGARAVLIGGEVLIADIDPARLAAVIDAPAPSPGRPDPPIPSRS